MLILTECVDGDEGKLDALLLSGIVHHEGGHDQEEQVQVAVGITGHLDSAVEKEGLTD